jgi:hypothetical protein
MITRAVYNITIAQPNLLLLLEKQKMMLNSNLTYTVPAVRCVTVLPYDTIPLNSHFLAQVLPIYLPNSQGPMQEIA